VSARNRDEIARDLLGGVELELRSFGVEIAARDISIELAPLLVLAGDVVDPGLGAHNDLPAQSRRLGKRIRRPGRRRPALCRLPDAHPSWRSQPHRHPRSRACCVDRSLGKQETKIDPARADRIRAAANEAAAGTERGREREAAANVDAPITKTAISVALGDVLEVDDIVFNGYWAAPELLDRTQPGTYFYLPPAGGLGWALPAALGAKHVAPDRTVVATVGDGAYVFANPAACHHAAAKHSLAVLTVIANNSTWGAVDLATRMVYPHGRAVAVGEHRFSDLSPTPDYAAYCQAAGGHGERVTTRARLVPAITEALDAVRRQGRQALLDIHCT
jgi:hypothetical protein